AEAVAGARAAEKVAGVALYGDEAAFEARGEVGSGVTADVEPSAAHGGAGIISGRAFDDDGPRRQACADIVEESRRSRDRDGVARRAGNRKEVADVERVLAVAERQVLDGGAGEPRELLRDQGREIDRAMRGGPQGERERAHVMRSFRW